MTTKIPLRVILPGGGVKGCFQIACLQEILASDKYTVDAVYGCSIGAILSPFVATQNLQPLVTMFRGIRSINDVVQRRTLFGRPLPSWKWLMGMLAFLKLGAYESIKICPELWNMLTPEMILEAQQKCHAVAYNITSDTETWFTGTNLETGITCSSALWLAVPPVSFEGSLYSDGGSVEVFPVDYILDHEMNTNFLGEYLFIDCDARKPYTNPNPTDGMTLMSYLQWGASLRLSAFELQKLQDNLQNKLTVIRPDVNFLTSALDIDPARMEQTFQAGTYKGNAFLQSRAILASHP